MWSAKGTTNVQRTIKNTRTPTIKNSNKTKGFSETHTKTERDKRGRVSFFMGFWLDQSRDVMMSFFYHPFDLFLLSI